MGTDGVGVSEARDTLRDYFEVSSRYIVTAALSSLFHQKLMNKKDLDKHLQSLEIDSNKPDPVKH